MTEQPRIPWKRQGFSVSADGLLIRMSSGPSGQSAAVQQALDDRKLALANLIAAAPELAESLRELLYICQCKCGPHDEVILRSGRTNEAAMIDAIAALNKAGIELL